MKLLLFAISAVAVSAQFEHFFSIDPPASPMTLNARLNSLQQRVDAQMSAMQKRIEKLEQQVAGLQQNVHSDWNTTDSGSMYKLFAERKSWDSAEEYCRSLNAHLAVIDNEGKNSFVTSLINEHPTADYIWIGMKTRTSASNAGSYSNFAADSPIDGCAVLDKSGVWSIRSCSQLRPFVCQMVVVR